MTYDLATGRLARTGLLDSQALTRAQQVLEAAEAVTEALEDWLDAPV